jgi:hypothetical protein
MEVPPLRDQEGDISIWAIGDISIWALHFLIRPLDIDGRFVYTLAGGGKWVRVP